MDMALGKPKIRAMQRPNTLKNEPKWIKDCTKIRARALVKAIVEKWQHPALDAAKRLVDRYAWSLEARAALRSAGHAD